VAALARVHRSTVLNYIASGRLPAGQPPPVRARLPFRRRFGDFPAPAWTLGRWGNPVMLAFALLAAVLMAVGSLLQL
jgi:hypothetical protein